MKFRVGDRVLVTDIESYIYNTEGVIAQELKNNYYNILVKYYTYISHYGIEEVEELWTLRGSQIKNINPLIEI